MIDLIESQTIEFKQIWKDEYLKTICALANSDGGEFYKRSGSNTIELNGSNLTNFLLKREYTKSYETKFKDYYL